MPNNLSYAPAVWPAPNQHIPDYGKYQVMSVSADDKRGRVYVCQQSPRYPILVFTHEGRLIGTWGANQFTAPRGCRVAPDGSVWVTDNTDNRVMRFTAEGRLLRTWGVRNVAGVDSTHFGRPADVAFGQMGDIYIADGYANARVVRLAADGRFVQAWGRLLSKFHDIH